MEEYFDIYGKIVLVDAIKSVISELIKKSIEGIWKTKDRKALVEAITSIQIATIKTRNFIKEKGYEQNEELSELWLDALNKVALAKIHDDLPGSLHSKAKFWGQPKDWIKNPETLKLVPKLNYLDEKCEMLLKQLD
jgi:hypothetical protein